MLWTSRVPRNVLASRSSWKASFAQEFKLTCQHAGMEASSHVFSLQQEVLFFKNALPRHYPGSMCATGVAFLLSPRCVHLISAFHFSRAIAAAQPAQLAACPSEGSRHLERPNEPLDDGLLDHSWGCSHSWWCGKESIAMRFPRCPKLKSMSSRKNWGS